MVYAAPQYIQMMEKLQIDGQLDKMAVFSRKFDEGNVWTKSEMMTEFGQDKNLGQSVNPQPCIMQWKEKFSLPFVLY